MGGIKSNVAPLMADQLGPNATADQLETVFRYFYWAINFGALIGMLLSPLVKRFGLTFPAPANASTAADVCASSNDPYTGYYVAYAMFTGVFGLAIVVFMYGYSFYVGYPPSGSMLARCISLCFRARRERRNAKASWFSLPEGGKNWLDWAKLSCDPRDFQLVDDLKQTLRTLLVFTVMPVYWLLYLQMTNTLVLQATMMYLPGGVSLKQQNDLPNLVLTG